jgi:hypothetical protein
MDQANARFVPPPPPSLNGGLYTGEPFQTNAPWANMPVTPEGTYMTSANLQSANPPPGAQQQYAGSLRPGNNYQDMPGVGLFSDKHSMLCSQPCVGTNTMPRFARYWYV